VSFPQISPQEAFQLVEAGSHIYLDVRSTSEFDLGHPSGAYNIPWLLNAHDPNLNFVPEVGGVFAREQPIIVGCQTGRRSKLACAALLEAGFSHVLEQRAGFDGPKDEFGTLIEPGWRRAGLPVSYDAEPGRSYRELSVAGRPTDPGVLC